MSIDDSLLLPLVGLLIVALILSAIAMIKRLPHRRASVPADIDSAFSFVPLNAAQLRDFTLEVAGLITLTTGLSTGIIRDPRLPGVDLDVFKGIRRVGMVSVIPPGSTRSVRTRLRVLAQYKQLRRIPKAYLVTGGAFSQDERHYARELGIALIDGASLELMRLKTRERPAPLPPVEQRPLTDEEIARWRKPKTGQLRRIFTSSKGFARGPWVDYH